MISSITITPSLLSSPLMFSRKPAQQTSASDRDPAFAYLPADTCYMDSACQTMRPQCVIDAETEYYLRTNACGGRVKYRWGSAVDEKVSDARALLLAMVDKSPKDYTVAFTLNTSYGINLVLHQLPERSFDAIVTSEIEHNSVVLPAMSWAKRNAKKRLVLPRTDEGNLVYQKSDLTRSVVLVSTVSNIDGRTLGNAKQLATDVHSVGGILLLDAAQGFAHDLERLKETDFDAAFGSGHKMYGPSIGFIIIRRTLLAQLEPFFIGGGTVTDVTSDAYALLRTGDEAYAMLEVGLQNWAGIIALRSAIRWLQSKGKNTQESTLSQTLFAELTKLRRVSLLNTRPSPIVSFSVDGLDAHRLALYLDEQKIMCRSGYFCCHAYLQHQRTLPPQLRVSLGLHNTLGDVHRFCEVLQKILSAL